MIVLRSTRIPFNIFTLIFFVSCLFRLNSHESSDFFYLFFSFFYHKEFMGREGKGISDHASI